MPGKFTGPLAEPMDPQLSSTGYAILTMHKLSLLFEHYGVHERDADGEENYIELLLKVCRDFVPGFASPKVKKRGRPATSAVDKLVLWHDITTLQDKRKCSVSSAASILVSSPKSSWHGKNKRTLENAFHNMWRDPMVYTLMRHLAAEQIERTP